MLVWVMWFPLLGLVKNFPSKHFLTENWVFDWFFFTKISSFCVKFLFFVVEKTNPWKSKFSVSDQKFVFAYAVVVLHGTCSSNASTVASSTVGWAPQLKYISHDALWPGISMMHHLSSPSGGDHGISREMQSNQGAWGEWDRETDEL